MLLLPFVLLLPPPLPSSSSYGMRNLDGWMTGRMDGKDDRTDRHLKYYISVRERKGKKLQ
jgi:hypothetical protein